MTSVLSQSATGGNVKNMCCKSFTVYKFHERRGNNFPEEHGDVTIEVISLICTHLYLTVS
jgi:hypothetical protein